jgi:hypothetical protein
MPTDPKRDALETQAIEAVSRLFAYLIRTEQDDPDYSGPEDVADRLATQLVMTGVSRLSAADWRSLDR